MPHVDILYSQLQKRTIDSVFVQGIMQQFTDNIRKIIDSLPTLCGEHSGSVSQLAKKRLTLDADRFQQHHSQFPEAALNTTMEAYPLLNKNKLKTELVLIYSNDEFKSCSGAVALYQLFMGNNLQDTFSETVDPHHNSYDHNLISEVLLNTEENQVLPEQHDVTGSSQYIGHALCGEESCQNHP
ncbi:hypothetical protein D5F01_LYC05608 [Larimichthys crocea]|uniref:Uncharacterized protein n=1 Tax=Larimichthys crocea TaxID=215358 RepID=A0A6G0IZ88_LARCR|nr:hypothetical protein D5F01_LYC05608 [Larimichthys crocea]